MFFHAVFQVWGSTHSSLEQQRPLHESSQDLFVLLFDQSKFSDFMLQLNLVMLNR